MTNIKYLLFSRLYNVTISSQEIVNNRFMQAAGYQRIRMERADIGIPIDIHRTSVHGVPLYWFPMRVTYNREVSVKEGLDRLSIENFLPMRYEIVGEGEKRRRMLVPAVHNLVFVRSTQPRITELKMTRREFLPMRYMMRHETADTPRQILRVPDKQMEDFIRVASVQDDSVMFLDYSDYLNKVGTRVRITEGQFAGVEGTVKRIKNNRRVVVQIEGVAAVAITYVPAHALIVL